MENLIPKLIEWGAQYGTKILAALAILVVGKIVTGWLGNVVGRIMTKAKVDPTLTKFITSLTKIALLVFVVLAAISKLGIQTTSFIAVLGAAGLAIGFALQGSLSNFASGVLLTLFRPIKVGDYVEAGGSAGSVEEIHIFNTILKTPDNKRVIIPNS